MALIEEQLYLVISNGFGFIDLGVLQVLGD
jgi:hypothetical protein